MKSPTQPARAKPLYCSLERMSRKDFHSTFLSGMVTPRCCFHCAWMNSATARFDSLVL
jgi:hypothetical protein